MAWFPVLFSLIPLADSCPLRAKFALQGEPIRLFEGRQEGYLCGSRRLVWWRAAKLGVDEPRSTEYSGWALGTLGTGHCTALHCTGQHCTGHCTGPSAKACRSDLQVCCRSPRVSRPFQPAKGGTAVVASSVSRVQLEARQVQANRGVSMFHPPSPGNTLLLSHGPGENRQFCVNTRRSASRSACHSCP